MKNISRQTNQSILTDVTPSYTVKNQINKTLYPSSKHSLPLHQKFSYRSLKKKPVDYLTNRVKIAKCISNVYNAMFFVWYILKYQLLQLQEISSALIFASLQSIASSYTNVHSAYNITYMYTGPVKCKIYAIYGPLLVFPQSKTA